MVLSKSGLKKEKKKNHIKSPTSAAFIGTNMSGWVPQGNSVGGAFVD
jgi:hypothetical protein